MKMKFVPPEEAAVIFQEAQLLQEQGARVYACAVTVAHTKGSAFGFGGKRATGISRYNPSWIIEELERAGWRLESLDHVWMQSSENSSLSNAAIIDGLVAAHMLFRRGSEGSPVA